MTSDSKLFMIKKFFHPCHALHISAFHNGNRTLDWFSDSLVCALSVSHTFCINEFMRYLLSSGQAAPGLLLEKEEDLEEGWSEIGLRQPFSCCDEAFLQIWTNWLHISQAVGLQRGTLNMVFAVYAEDLGQDPKNGQQMFNQLSRQWAAEGARGERQRGILAADA